MDKTLSEICCSECLIKSRFRKKRGHGHNQFGIQYRKYIVIDILYKCYIWDMLHDVHCTYIAMLYFNLILCYQLEHNIILKEKWFVMSEPCQLWRDSYSGCLTWSNTLWFGHSHIINTCHKGSGLGFFDVWFLRVRPWPRSPGGKIGYNLCGFNNCRKGEKPVRT